MVRYFYICLFYILLFYGAAAQQKAAPKPLFDDPVYHGAADPVVIFNKQKKSWWMFYTNRRASIRDSTVKWVHGTKIGIAESKDGWEWKYLDTANINYRPDKGYTFWAPDIVEEKGVYHMYLTYVPGIFKDWSHPRTIIHLTSRDLLNWDFKSVLKLAGNKVIDPTVVKVDDHHWMMWYNNENDGKTIYYTESDDLYHWVDRGKAVNVRGEGPKVFRWKGKYFMIVDVWKGMAVFSGDDLIHWIKQKDRILEISGHGKDDHVMGGHCDVVVNDDQAYIFYFTHPGRRSDHPAPLGSFENKRSVIQLAKLQYVDDEIRCDRDKGVNIQLEPLK